MEILDAFIFAIVLNLVMFIPAFIFKTDKLTDISYAVTFGALAIFGYVNSEATDYQFILLTMLLLWAYRLGIYLLYRVTKKGRDARFDGKREDFWYFLRFWFLQGLTVAVVMIPAMIAMESSEGAVGTVAIVGLVVYSVGLILETVADMQKDNFNNEPKNKGKWIDEGVWSWSRHPNYLGEMLVWAGVYVYAISALEGWQYAVGLISPLYIILLLSFGSGIPILEKNADKKWGKNKEYQKYKERVGILLPKI